VKRKFNLETIRASMSDEEESLRLRIEEFAHEIRELARKYNLSVNEYKSDKGHLFWDIKEEVELASQWNDLGQTHRIRQVAIQLDPCFDLPSEVTEPLRDAGRI